MRAFSQPGGPRLAVLSYHSWDVEPAVLGADIRALRKDGWRFVSAREALDFVHGRLAGTDERLALVTSDDGHPEDVEFRDTLRREGCPGVTFVNVGRADADRLAWFRETHSEEWSVQDHGPLHRRQFVSGHLTGVVHGQKIGGLEYLALPMGAPLLASAGQLASPRFDPHPEVIALAAEWASEQGTATISSPAWLAEISERLRRLRLAYRWRSRTYVVGSLETNEEFERRVKREVAEGRTAFEDALGHAPTMFAYPWWQGSSIGDDELSRSGYEATFAGTGYVQGRAMSPYSIPRVVMDPTTPRPLNLAEFAERSTSSWSGLRGRVERAAKRMMGVI
ncbi:MAG: polysaccharide deacetylase family protein [Gemmatimonadaceae bacterium]|nr:polysaccharide deacetylase family protein [Gemmatimonadaceae bacterium]